MVVGLSSIRELLETAYSALDFNEGELLDADATPNDLTLEQWINKGDWLSLAKQVGAEKIFFVEDDPVIVFASRETQDRETLRQAFNSIWCMARPQILFLAIKGELSVYDLTKPPAKTLQEWEKIKPLAIVKKASEVAKKLNNYHREIVESGKLFEEKHFGHDDQRADQSLIRDLKTVRARLTSPSVDKKLDDKYAHALIGRSIFIRYLEDREILTRDYFEEVAAKNPAWKVILNREIGKSDIHQDMERLLYPRVLEDKEFTYALFDKLSEDFNGDMFPSDIQEKKAVDIEHLKLVQGFLRGDVDPQQKLFFWAYKFDIIPIELISSIYEEFYLTSNADSGNHGTHYTPSSLVRFVLSKVLTPQSLEKNPRIIDPCCGSGIFLVEAFRRIVRYLTYKQNGTRLGSEELRKIIREQIAGIEINEEAVRVAAFSLYLALLHYQQPPAIWEQIKNGQTLPSLKYQKDILTSNERFNNLIEANAFDIESKVNDINVLSDFGSSCADIVVGNPPWGEPKDDDKLGKAALEKGLKWCSERGYPVGDKERSQVFIWRTLDLLRDGGYAGLLVSTGIFFKRHQKSKQFRQQLLSSIKLIEVINFSHTRDIFFKAISPFASIVFQKTSDIDTQQQIVDYFSAKKSAHAASLKSVVLSHVDIQRVRQSDFIENDKLWKIYWWGNHRDHDLIDVLELNPPLRDFCDIENSGQGFQKGKGKDSFSSEKLPNYREFPTRFFTKYGLLDMQQLKTIPERLYRTGKSENLYSGMRILIKRGISQTTSPKGQIISRLESSTFCFRHSIYCIKLAEPTDWRYKVILGILWSSLARYYFFLTSSNWGNWHYEIYYHELLDLPIRFPEIQEQRDKLVLIVDKLINFNLTPRNMLALNGKTQLEINKEIAKLESQLDGAVFDLYELRVSERDLIRDMCDTGIEFFYNNIKSQAVKPVIAHGLQLKYGVLQDISSAIGISDEFKDYLSVFLKIWNREIYPEGEFSWRIISSCKITTMLCVIFSTQEVGQSFSQLPENDEDAWIQVLRELDDSLLVPYDSNRIYIDGMIRVVTDTNIIIIKRNQKRLWTKSMAREDVEATLIQAINLQESNQDISL
ncbi:class I SAM-dependent DNA methyltransferase [Anabaena sp. UHCC 0204]|uniref:HsdM family class I SAM-dependent methyltransferase n=1 Tax=Anabaena sp. UHCC 0204 TaxID=2590009 RepID=UPI00144765E7|nr:N-6 DNA methylase [Anabaena sp. UHCC 0204]MTJ08783.1 N-6 DNA methylase [Anabaena sp. UHCC 0204]